MQTAVDLDHAARLRAFLDTIVATTRTAIAATSRDELLLVACDALVSRGAFAMAWIGADEDADGWVEPLAIAGDSGGYVAGARISLLDVPEGRGPTGTAVRTGEPWLCTDVRLDERMTPWRDRMLSHGFLSNAAFPLRSRAMPTGALTVYAPVAGAFGADEALVLEDVASTIGLAIDGLVGRQSLAESEERYRLLMESSADGILVSDESGKYVAANPAVCAMFGYSREEILSRPVAAFAAPDDAVAPGDLAPMLDESPSGLLLERRYVRSDGTILPTETSYVRLPDGRVQRTIRDITARKLAEAAVRASEHQLRLVLDNTADVIWVIDRDNQITWSSPSIVRVLGWQPDEFVGHRLAEFIHPDDEPAAAVVRARLVAGETARVTMRIRSAPGDWRWLEVDGTPLFDEAGAVNGRVSAARDVTERVEAEHAVERLATAIEQSADTIVVTDLAANIVYANPAFESTTGYTRAEAMGRNPSLLQSGTHDDAFYDRMWSTLTAGETWRGELHNRRKDGSEYVEEAAISPVRGPGGAITHYVAVKRDVTAQREAERALARLAAAVDRAGDSVLVTDPDGTIVYVNPQFEASTGYTREEVLGKNPRILKSGAHDDAVYREMWQELAAGRVWRGEFRNLRKDGSAVTVATVIAPVTGSDGRLESYVAVQHDVTEERRAQEALRRSEEQYRSLVEELDAIVWVADIGTGEWFCSPQVEAILGYPVEEVLRRDFWRSLLVDEDRDATLAFWDSEEGVDGQELEYRVRARDGRVLTLHERWRAARDAAGKAVRWYAVTHDVTRARRMEDAVARAERLDSMARVTAAAAHDFGNVLQGIMIYQSFLAEAIRPGDPSREDVDQIGQAAQKGLALTRQMSAIGRDAPRGERELIDPAAVLTGMTSMLSAVASPAHLTVDATPCELVMAPRGLIEQAVLNLVINARDALAGRGGSIAVRLSAADRVSEPGDALPDGRYVELSVADDGPGMPPEVRERAFEPFFTTKAHGTGIGLASVYGSARDLGGTAFLETAPGAGTNVRIVLPAAMG